MSPELIGGGIALVSFLAGQWLPRPHPRKRIKGPKPVEPVCGCTHHHSFHDPKTGECSALMRVPSTMSRDSYHTPCTCRQYSGPVPVPEYFAPEITP